MAYSNNLEWGSLAPQWVSVKSDTVGGTLDLINYGSKIQSTDVNNGAEAGGFIKGSASGQFKIQFKLGKVWGWSNLYAANIKAVAQNSLSQNNYLNGNYNGVTFYNNSSNNKFKVDKSVLGVITSVTDQTGGLNNIMITFWRDSNNVVKYKAGASAEVTIGTFADHWVFYTSPQSPCSCELLAAYNENVTLS